MRPEDLLGFCARAILGNRLRSALSLVGVTIGVASVILLTSLGEGARLYVLRQFAEIGSNLVIVLPGKTETTGALPLFGGVPNDLTLEDMEALRRQVPGIRRIAPVTVAEAEVRHAERGRQVTVFGTTDEMREIRRLKMNVGRYLPPGDPRQGERVCVIGTTVQRELFPGVNPLGEILRIGDERFRIIGVTQHLGQSLGMDMDDVVAIPVSECMRMFDQTSLFRIIIETGAREQIPAVKARAVEVLTERHDEEDVTVMTQDAVMGSLDSILTVLTAAIAGIAAISLTVAGVAIMNVMLVSVTERTSEVGLLKALGVTRKQVVAAFLVEAAILSTAGGVLGLLGGFAGVLTARALWPSFPVTTPAWAVAASLVVSLAVGLAFGSLPASRASRLDPVLALGRR